MLLVFFPYWIAWWNLKIFVKQCSAGTSQTIKNCLKHLFFAFFSMGDCLATFETKFIKMFWNCRNNFFCFPFHFRWFACIWTNVSQTVFWEWPKKKTMLEIFCFCFPFYVQRFAGIRNSVWQTMFWWAANNQTLLETLLSLISVPFSMDWLHLKGNNVWKQFFGTENVIIWSISFLVFFPCWMVWLNLEQCSLNNVLGVAKG